MAEENLTEVVASSSNTDNNLATSYDNLQERLDYLYDEEWFTPNAFYPSLFKRATDNEGLSNQLACFEGETNGYTNTAGREESKATLEALSLEGLIAREERYFSRSGNRDILGGMNTRDGRKINKLHLIESVDGLDFIKLPLAMDGYRIKKTNDERNTSKSITIKVSLEEGFEVYYRLNDWLEGWYTNRTTRKALQVGPVAEGYLSLNYVKIRTDGSTNILARVSIAGLIPQHVGFVTSIGPAVKGDKTSVAVKCLYSQAQLQLRNPDDPSKSKIIYFD